jgi:hypothetical protein
LVLVAAGAGIGAVLREPANAAPANRNKVHRTGTATPGASTHSPSLPPGQPHPYRTQFPASGTAIAMAQVQGDGNTDFVVHGYGWPPGGVVTLWVTGDGSAQKKLIVDGAGTFNYAIGHDPVFFRRRIPLGWHQVVATVPGVKTAYIRFHVIKVPPPGSPPPGEGGPLGPG